MKTHLNNRRWSRCSKIIFHDGHKNWWNYRNK